LIGFCLKGEIGPGFCANTGCCIGDVGLKTLRGIWVPGGYLRFVGADSASGLRHWNTASGLDGALRKELFDGL